MFDKYLGKIKELVSREIFSFLNISKGYLAIADGYFMTMKQLPEDEDRLTIENLMINPEGIEKFEKHLQKWGEGTTLAEGVYNPKLIKAAMLPHEAGQIHFRLVKVDDMPIPLLFLLSEDTFSVVMGMETYGIVDLYEPWKEVS